MSVSIEQQQAAINEVLVNKRLISDVASEFGLAKRSLYSLIQARQKPNKVKLSLLKQQLNLIEQQIELLSIN
ncbi:hypothetical protein PULV_b0781 [Pseudoalteromonas ulvae UL12]|uniref:HTH psq-type domain-containing protein n=1 Tax=Pseudoalteromonas ulvae TaxID=107327 RepID=A0A244CRJ6_PSEDV|nr:hypothetical protein [Pseudoalteromonas ulvae]MBE0366050.1 hypothetical protein [Pseudoalteromonas ulvae UL12]OUL58225.1 hypothetical protein B1199_07685 [Pseudoalteromonas ulvae]